ncbi:MAG: hypothetical protein U9Q07_01325 [Planctomycetota bacterium]|nr:hypothetical protein [Planctomycetota bacterium]
MKTANHRILIKTTCVLLVLLTSASLVEAYPPDNAAVLYYKAIMILKEPSEDVGKMIDDLRKGKIKSNDEIKQHLDANRRAIEIIETAAEIPTCDWGRDHSQGFDLLLPELSKVRKMAYLLTADAQTFAQDGDRKAALSKCLTMHKMARHVNDDLLISYLVSTSVNNLANERIRDVLSTMPQDSKTLAWLKTQIAAVSANVPSIKTAIAKEKEIAIREIRREKIGDVLDAMGADSIDDKATADAYKKVRQGDRKFFKDSRDYYGRIMDDTIAALDLPYQQSHRKLDELNDRVQKDAKENPAAILTAMLTPAVGKIRTAETKNKTFFNAIRASVDIYMVKAKTGRLPEKLPADSPKDLFSGKDFEYDKTKDGFVLRCQAKDLDKDEIYQYEFKVAK